MLQLIKNNSPFTVIVLFIFALCIKLPVLLHPQLPAALPGYLLYNNIVDIFRSALGNSAFGFTMLSVVMLFAQAIFLNTIVVRYKLFSRPTYIPAYIYITVTSLLPVFSYFSCTLLVNWVLLGSINIMLGFNQSPKPRKHIFNAGFLICIAALLQFSAIAYLLLFLAGMSILRSFSAAEWAVGIMGYVTPLYFTATILFLIDKFQAIRNWPHLQVVLPAAIVFHDYFMITVFSCLLLLVLSGLYGMQLHVPKASIYIRRNWLLLVVYLIISIVIAFLSYLSFSDIWLLIMPALSLVISHALYLEKRKRFSNFVFYFSLIFIIFCQVAYK